MRSLLSLISAIAIAAAAGAQAPVTTARLIAEAYDLARLARLPSPAYDTVQFSSYDRRSTTGEAPGWFENADGFGNEPQPGFQAVLRAPDDKGIGLYLVADVRGPGAIVRGWTAGMGGTLRVFLDDGEAPVFTGPAGDFLRGRTRWFLGKAGVTLDTANAFVQEDADYLPMPFAQALKVTWEGTLRELHFYQLQVRRYAAGTAVTTFDPTKDLADLAEAVRELTAPRNRHEGTTHALAARIAPGETWSWTAPGDGPRAITELRLRVAGKRVEEALRQTLLRIAFDGASIPQVEAPLGDFFGSGPGIQPYVSLPLTVDGDGWLSCRFVMPFAQSASLSLTNLAHGGPPLVVEAEGQVTVSPWSFGEDALYFRAKWRADHDLVADRAGIDLPYLLVLGRGRLAGVACMIMNPSGVPTPGGNWWGEGDEKVLVDGEATPSTFGTGSEDFYNYSWSRPGLFAHPYCGQPLTSGPGNSGYVSNHRFLILDDLPFTRSLAFFMELKHHNRTPGLSYARIAWHYARPGAVDDHRALGPADLVIPPLPVRVPVAAGAARGASFFLSRDLAFTVRGAEMQRRLEPLAPTKVVRGFVARGGETARTTITLPGTGVWELRLVARLAPDGGALRVHVNGKPLVPDGIAKGDVVSLHEPFVTRFQNVFFAPVECEGGANEVLLEAVAPGVIAFDYIWARPRPSR